MRRSESESRLPMTYRLARTLCLFMLLLPAIALAQSRDGRLEPDAPPVPVTAQSQLGAEVSEPAGAPADLAATIRQEVESALDNVPESRSSLALLIPIVALFLIFGGPLVVIIVLAVLHYRSKNTRAKIRAESILRALESGRDLPLDLFDEKAAGGAQSDRNRGIRNLALGCGIVVALTLLAGISVGALGFILVGIGTGQLVLWRLDSAERK